LDSFLKILTLILISSVKFAFGPPFAYLHKDEFTWFEANVYAILGGMIGVTLFMHISEWLIRMWDRIRNFYFKNKNKKQRKRVDVFSEPVADTDEQIEIHYQYVESHVPPKKIFTKRSRRIVKIWRRYGLIGLAALTPVIFSIPLGTFFMTRYEKNRNKIFFYMFISITLWSLILTTFFQLAHIKSH
jgi:uncharacterized membrane protein